MVQVVKVEGHEAFKAAAKEHEGKTIFALFCGSKDANGESWCPDCVVADPVVNSCLDGAPSKAVFIYCSVGGRDFWKDKNNVFRTDETLRLKSVPTLMCLGKSTRLEEGQCADRGLVEMLFEED